MYNIETLILIVVEKKAYTAACCKYAQYKYISAKYHVRLEVEFRLLQARPTALGIVAV
jgi:hypothetical protein